MTMQTKIAGIGLICIFGIFILGKIFFTPHITVDQTEEADNSSLAGASETTGSLWRWEILRDPFTDAKNITAGVEGEEGSYIVLVCFGGSDLRAVMKFNHIEHLSLTNDRATIMWRANKKTVNTIGAKIYDNTFVMPDGPATRHLAKNLLTARTFAASVTVSDKKTIRVYENLKNSRDAVGEVLHYCNVE